MEYSQEEIYRYVRHKTRGGRGLIFQWHITDRCNFRCSHCYQETYSGDELEFDELLMVFDQFKALHNRMIRESKPFPVRAQINVTGGEPFVRKDFLDLLEVLCKDERRYSIGILCNGSFMDEGMARRLRDLGVRNIQVSIEGKKETNDRIRAKGSFDDASRAVKNMVKAGGIRTGISFTSSRENFREFGDVAQLGCELGASIVWSDRLIPWGSGAECESLTPDETRELFQIMHNARVKALQESFRTRIGMSRALQFLVGGGRPYHCGAGERAIIVMPNGDVYPCRRMPIRVGNVKEKTLEEIYYTNELLIELRDRERIPEECRGCEYDTLCRGGLRCLSYAVTGDPFRADPGCWLVESNRVKSVSNF